HDTTSTSFSRCSVYCLPDRTDGRLIVTLRRRPARSTLFPYTTLFRSVPRRLTADGLRQVIAFITRMTAADRAELGGVSAERSTQDRKSTRLNSSHVSISYAVFCLKKKKKSTLMPPNNKQTISTTVYVH